MAAMAGPVTITGVGRLEYNANYWREGSGFGFADLTVAVDIPASRFTISPFILLQAGIDDGFEDFREAGLLVRADF